MTAEVQLKGVPGRGIAILRHIGGMSQPQLAERVNLSSATVSHIELGTRQLCDVHVPVFASALKCSRDLVRWARGDDLGVDKEFALGIELAELFRKHTARPTPRAVHEKWQPAKRRKLYPRDMRYLIRKRRLRESKRLRAATSSAGAADTEAGGVGDAQSRQRHTRRGAVA